MSSVLEPKCTWLTPDWVQSGLLELLERLVVAMEAHGYARTTIDAEVDRFNAAPPERRMDPAVRAGNGRFSMPGGF